MESSHAIEVGELLSFSEQQLVDCSKKNYGCGGGWQYKAFEYLEKKAAMLESEYPYTAKEGTCNYSAESNSGVNASGYKNVSRYNPQQMKAALSLKPLAVSIQADQPTFQSYKSGIFNSGDCGSSLNHATNVVGWGSEDGVDYWVMRNSWGKSWGESGYMRIQIVEGGGICGVQLEPLYPITN